MLRFQWGVSILFVAVVLIIVAAASLAFLALTRSSAGIDRSNETTSHLAKIGNALEQFASASERLPCPANRALDTGDAEPNAASAACTYSIGTVAIGTVPWRTLGLRREDAFDAWGWKISYRVYQGATGLTQAGGASMVHCDTVEPTPAGTSPAGLCLLTHDTTEAQFLNGKGLSVSDFGAPLITDAAYVLISHGPSGLGAYTTSGTQKTPLPSSADETANLGTGTFVAKAAVNTVSPEDATHFDDVLAYRHLADFVRRSNLSARDWPEAGATYADVTLNTVTVSAALGTSPPYGDLGRATLNFQDATVTGLNSGGTQNLSFDNVNSVEGIGTTGGTVGSANALSSDAGEGVRIVFPLKARQLAVTFNEFGRHTGTPGNPHEQAEFIFFDGAATVLTVTKQGCKPDGGLATFSIDALVDFDRVEIRARTASDGTSVTQFFLSQIKTCAPAVACTTSMSLPGNSCP